jgi:hypothetical protein
MASTCEHYNDISGRIKGGEFLHQPSRYQLIKEDSAPRSPMKIEAEIDYEIQNGEKP